MLVNVETLETRQVSLNRNCRHEALPTFSPSGKQLAIVCSHNRDDIELMVANVDGTSPRSVATFRDYLGGLAWVPDESSMVVYTNTPTAPDINQVRLSDGRMTSIPGVNGGNWPTVSKDGTKLAYTTYDVQIGLWRKDLQHPEAAPEAVAASTQIQNMPKYSPDGKHIAFASQRTGELNVWLADADGTNLVQLSKEGFAGYPWWSPDSQKVVFSSGGEGLPHQSLRDRHPRTDAAPAENRRIPEASAPMWSNDGKWIYYRGMRGTSRQLYRCPATGGDSVLVADIPEMNDAHMESRDGKTMYFTKGDGDLMALTAGRSES